MRTLVLTGLALVAFAANSVLCRLALGAHAIDAASFTSIRLASGALALFLIAAVRRRPSVRPHWISAAMLFLYAIAFSFAYYELSAGTGALILFGTVQATMLLVAIAGGERPPAAEWLGLALALGGLVYLVFPGLHAPSPLGAVLMCVAGLAWGVYSLRGRGATDPVGETARNFAWAVPPALLASLIARQSAHASAKGILLATCSGVVTSGLGYVIWYAALPRLTSARAALVQLAVPLIAAAAGAILLHETLTPRLLVAAVLILGGIGVAQKVRSAPRSARRSSG